MAPRSASPFTSVRSWTISRCWKSAPPPMKNRSISLGATPTPISSGRTSTSIPRHRQRCCKHITLPLSPYWLRTLGYRYPIVSFISPMRMKPSCLPKRYEVPAMNEHVAQGPHRRVGGDDEEMLASGRLPKRLVEGLHEVG